MVISGVIGPRIWLITFVALPITPFLAAHEPPSTP